MATFASQLDAAVPDVARAAWEHARAHWQESAAHDELLRLTTLHGCYAWVAARYREASGEAGDLIAEQQLDRTRRAAEAALLTSAGPRRDKGGKPFQSSMLVLVFIFLLLVVGILFAKHRASGDAPPAPRAPAGRVR